jgi:[NiFe] hydrogenase diaphorase moiety small subunit
VSSDSGKLADTNLSLDDKAMSVCPVGAILRKGQGFQVPIGRRTYDAHPISEVAVGAGKKG